MSKILRRPMFRGGPVDSYNTGIASGLGDEGYADGGRVAAKIGGFFNFSKPGGNVLFTNPFNNTGKLLPTASYTSGTPQGGLTGLTQAYQSLIPNLPKTGNLIKGGAVPLSIAASPFFIFEEDPLRNKPEEKELQDTATKLTENFLGQPRRKLMEDVMSGTRSKAESPYTGFDYESAQREAKQAEAKYTGANKLGGNEEDGKKAYLEQEKRDQEERDRLTKRKNLQDTNEINIEDIEKESKLYQKLLGGEEAKQQALYDALLAASPAFFKGKNLREAAPEVLTAINKSGAFDKPRDIKQAAAQLAIQRRMLVDKAAAEGRAKVDYLSEKKPSTFSEAILQYGKGQEPTPYLVKTVAQMFTGEPPLDVPGAKIDETGNLVNYKQDKLIPNKFYVSGSNLYIARYNPDGRLVLIKRG